jgi:hypothetical protein
VRLPRDWLGPREELVPIGPAAHARAAAAAADELADQALPPTAFWSQDSAALHDAVQAPSADPVDPWPTPAPLAPQSASRRRIRGPRLQWPGPSRARWAVLAVPAVALVVLAVLGSNEQRGGASRSASRRNVAPAPAHRATIAAVRAAARRGAGSRHARTHPPRHVVADSRARGRGVRAKTERDRTVPRRSHARASPTPSVAAAATTGASPGSGDVSTTPVSESSPSGGASSGSAGVSSSTSRSVSATPAEPAGPPGPSSLIGPGTSPSG